MVIAPSASPPKKRASLPGKAAATTTTTTKAAKASTANAATRMIATARAKSLATKSRRSAGGSAVAAPPEQEESLPLLEVAANVEDLPSGAVLVGYEVVKVEPNVATQQCFECREVIVGAEHFALKMACKSCTYITTCKPAMVKHEQVHGKTGRQFGKICLYKSLQSWAFHWERFIVIYINSMLSHVFKIHCRFNLDL